MRQRSFTHTQKVCPPSLMISALCLLSSPAEDILDEVSGLTVNSPDDSMEEGARLNLHSPGGHQEDKTSVGTGQKVSATARNDTALKCTQRHACMQESWGLTAL